MVKDGVELSPTSYEFGMIDSDQNLPVLSFSEDKSKFLIYNYLVDKENTRWLSFKYLKSVVKHRYTNIISIQKSSALRERTTHC